jgi:hypothetical protein
VHEDDRIALPLIEKCDFHPVVLETLHIRTAQSLLSTARRGSLQER